MEARVIKKKELPRETDFKICQDSPASHPFQIFSRLLITAFTPEVTTKGVGGGNRKVAMNSA